MIKWVVRWKWAVISAWLITAIGLFMMAPDMEELVREKGQIAVPDGYSSAEALRLLNELQAQTGGGNELQTVVVFHNPEMLSELEWLEAEKAIQQLNNQKEALGINSILSHFDQLELEPQMVSNDGTTILALLSVVIGDRVPIDVKDQLYAALQGIQVNYYFTGGWLIDEDVLVSSQEGLKKTEYITVGFILIILFIVFRSLVAPIIPLVTVGISYITAQSVVAFLVDGLNFPLSTFTQIFMVAVMFGIGTDYCILLISRFKEQLTLSEDTTSAVIETYRSAGKTVFFAGLAVLVGFSSIGLSTFILYQSAVAVAVGIAVLMLALVTIVPFFMAVLGKKTFWPLKGSLEHKENKLWGWAGSLALRRPIISLLIVAAIITPFLLTYNGALTYNSMDEIGDDYDSVKGFNIISDRFGPGETMPITIVMKHNERMDQPNAMAFIEQMSQEIARMDGIKYVRSATRPTGEVIQDFSVTNQAALLEGGLGEGNAGLTQIQEGLSEASVALSESSPQISEAAEAAIQLANGTQQLKQGIEELSLGIAQINAGLNEGIIGLNELIQGLDQAAQSAELLYNTQQELFEGYTQLSSGLTSLTVGYESIAAEMNNMKIELEQVMERFESLENRYPELNQDEDFQTIKITFEQMQQGLDQIHTNLQQMNGQLTNIDQGIQRSNAGLAQTMDGQGQLTKGLKSLLEGLKLLSEGIRQAAQGQSQMTNQMPEIIQGMDQIYQGQVQVAEGFNEMNEQLEELTDGMKQSVEGMQQVSSGLSLAQDYLTELAGAPIAGWLLPEEALIQSEFKQVLDAYMSLDRKIMTMDAILINNPYFTESLEMVPKIEEAVKRVIHGTEWEQSEFAIGGVTSIYADLNQISAADFKRTSIFMLIGIFLILFILFKSIVMPIYLVLSLILTYYTSLAVAEVIFVDIAGYSGLTWAVPFFAFVMLMALGIDYSIFLMDRFKEYKHLPAEEAIHLAMRKMGTVIISAVVILGGTFAAMLPSGVLSLMQIATIVLTGLFMYSFVFLPFFVPVMVKIFGKANFWPFMTKENKS